MRQKRYSNKLPNSNKANKQKLQKSITSTNSAGQFSGSQIRIKQEPIMATGNKGQNFTRQSRDQSKRRTYESRNNTSLAQIRNSLHDVEERLGRDIGNCPATGKSCKNCKRPKHFVECVVRSK